MNWAAVHAEATLLALACLVALVDLWRPGRDRIVTYTLTQLSLFAVAMIQLWYFDRGSTVYAMERMVVADPMGHLLGVFATLATMITLVYARPYAGSRDMLKGELFTLSMFSLLGILVMLQANNFLVVYLGLELMSLSLYALVALRRDNAQATESSTSICCQSTARPSMPSTRRRIVIANAASFGAPPSSKVTALGEPW